tara:strand:- start:12668 stop:13609 length:942 start_codon:yes stop_codon:yes gene_type:complete
MKSLVDKVPWYICDSGDENLCAYVDTDSNYFSAYPILKHYDPNIDNIDPQEVDNRTEKIGKRLEGVMNKFYVELGADTFNIGNRENFLEMKTECVIRSGYFRNTRRYAQWITKTEGRENETLEIKGLEFMKANFPPVLGKFFNSILRQVLKGVEYENIISQIKIFKKEILEEIPIYELGNPTAVKKLDKYSGTSARTGEMFTVVEKGAPAPVRAALKYNDLLKFWRLDKQFNLITQSDKVKWIYLKDNPYKIEALAFMTSDVPPKIEEFLNRYADRKKVFESILLNKLEGFFGDLGWNLNLNPHLDKFKSFVI